MIDVRNNNMDFQSTSDQIKLDDTNFVAAAAQHRPKMKVK
jgi:hypothetical protein